jgi:fluoroquinolone transport system ATP-binding protein
MITVKSLFHDYSGKGILAVRDVSFNINQGEIFGFLGPSGAGKSTVQNLMTGLLPLQHGSIHYGDVSVKDLTPAFFNKAELPRGQPRANLYQIDGT